MTDAAFIAAFEDCTLPPDRFGHREHLRLAWLLLRARGRHAGAEAVRRGIRRYAEAQGAAGRYHETLTSFWIALVGHSLRCRPEVDDFETFLASFPFLLDASLPGRHWRGAVLRSDEARAAWVEPDLLPLPA